MQNKYYDLEITGLAHDGRGIGKIFHADSVKPQVVFVRGALPMQKVRISIDEQKKSFAQGTCVEVLQDMPNALPAFCPHAHICGGCPLQTMPYAEQLQWKEKIINDAMQRIAKCDAKVQKVYASPLPWAYRNKMEFSFAQNPNKSESNPNPIILGLHSQASHKVFDTTQCKLMPEQSMAILDALRTEVQQSHYGVWSKEHRKGLWRFAVLRMPHMPHNNEVQSTLSLITAKSTPEQKAFIKSIGRQLMAQGLITAFVHEERYNSDNYALGERTICQLGSKFLHEKLAHIDYAYSHASFFQVNSLGAEILAKKAQQLSDLHTKKTIWDIYCGVGALGLNLAQEDSALYGVEIQKSAIDLAKLNAQSNFKKGLNFNYLTGDALKILSKSSWPKADLILLDPPRAGLHANLAQLLSNSQAQNIIYISCNPATLARDINILAANYSVQELWAVDLFPQTMHVESIALLSKL